MKLKTLAAFFWCVLAAGPRPLAQAPAPQGQPGALTRGFPQVHADRTVTFKLVAWDARDASVRLQGVGVRPMAREESGVWTITVGPLDPEIYEYSFIVNGSKVLDVTNPFVKMGEFAASLLDVPGTPARFDEWREVPHGTLQLLTYTSSSYGVRRNLYVYLPPQYESNSSRRFPVLYLRHGNGDDETAWPFEGRAGVILENLIADGKALPMVIVMPYGESGATGGGSPEGMIKLDAELRADIMPLVERRFRVSREPRDRAIAGLSMGGRQAATIGLRHLDQFSWIGSFSAGNTANEPISQFLPSLLDARPELGRLRLLFISCGTEDPRYPMHRAVQPVLDERGVKYTWFSTPGNHEFKVWRHSLAEFLPLLFRSVAPRN